MSEEKPKPCIFIFEPDASHHAHLTEALTSVAPEHEIEFFPESAKLVAALDRNPILVIYQMDHGGLPAEFNGKPFKIIGTSFKGESKSVIEWMKGPFWNIIHQPFDLPLLKQHLKLAMPEVKSDSGSALFQMQTKANIEMLKEIPMEGISEIGFASRSDREVPLGRVVRYYGKAFEWGTVISIYARTLSQAPHPQNPKDKTVLLTWFAAGKDQLLQIRARTPKKSDMKFLWPAGKPQDKWTCLIIADPSPAGSELSGTLTRAFTNIEVKSSSDIPDTKTAFLQKPDCIFIHHSFLERILKDSRFQGVPLILMSERTLKDEELRDYAQKAIDVLTLPTERMTFFKKMAVLFPGLAPSEQRVLLDHSWKETLNVGQPIEVVEISEAGLVMKYERPLPEGTFRRFVLWQPIEAGTPILTARCFETKPDSGKPGTHINRFIFFGMSDHEIKHVRIWMRDHYIQSKSKN